MIINTIQLKNKGCFGLRACVLALAKKALHLYAKGYLDKDIEKLFQIKKVSRYKDSSIRVEVVCPEEIEKNLDREPFFISSIKSCVEMSIAKVFGRESIKKVSVRNFLVSVEFFDELEINLSNKVDVFQISHDRKLTEGSWLPVERILRDCGYKVIAVTNNVGVDSYKYTCTFDLDSRPGSEKEFCLALNKSGLFVSEILEFKNMDNKFWVSFEADLFVDDYLIFEKNSGLKKYSVEPVGVLPTSMDSGTSNELLSFTRNLFVFLVKRANVEQRILYISDEKNQDDIKLLDIECAPAGRIGTVLTVKIGICVDIHSLIPVYRKDSIDHRFSGLLDEMKNFVNNVYGKSLESFCVANRIDQPAGLEVLEVSIYLKDHKDIVINRDYVTAIHIVKNGVFVEDASHTLLKVLELNGVDVLSVDTTFSTKTEKISVRSKNNDISRKILENINEILVTHGVPCYKDTRVIEDFNFLSTALWIDKEKDVFLFMLSSDFDKMFLEEINVESVEESEIACRDKETKIEEPNDSKEEYCKMLFYMVDGEEKYFLVPIGWRPIGWMQIDLLNDTFLRCKDVTGDFVFVNMKNVLYFKPQQTL